MSASGKAREIFLGDDFGDVAVRVNGVRVEVHTDGSILAYTKSRVDAYTNGPVQVHPAGNGAAKAEEAPEIGDKMPAGHLNAGWIYAGISRTTHEPFYVASKDSGVFKWKEAMAFAAKDGSRVPSKEELDQIYDAKDKGALKGTFNVTGLTPGGWYWSSSQSYYNFLAWAQRFSFGNQYSNFKYDASSLRCVR